MSQNMAVSLVILAWFVVVAAASRVPLIADGTYLTLTGMA